MEYFWVADIIGICAFAISGFLVAVRRGLDVLGVAIAAFSTALGGGIIRDVIVDKIPFAFIHSYPFFSVLIAIFLAIVLKIHKKEMVERRVLFVVMDSIGLIAFSVTGALIGVEFGLNLFGVLLLSFITAVGGGILRDVLINEIPFVLVNQFYGSVALLNALLIYSLFKLNMLEPLYILICSIFALTLRLIAYFRDWHLPKIG